MSFRDWYLKHQDAITWFLIGFLMCSGFVNLSNDRPGWACIDFSIAFLNYFFVRQKEQ